MRFACFILIVCLLKFIALSNPLSSKSTYSTSPRFVFKPDLAPTPQSPELSFFSVTEFLAMFVGCDHERFDPFLEVSYLDNSRPLSFAHILAASNVKKRTYRTSVFLSNQDIKSKNSRHALLLFSLLFLSGNVELNPGPTYKYPCGDCSRPCKCNQPAIQCDNCQVWYHKKCLQMNSKVYEALANSSLTWICCQCGLPSFSSSFFDSSTSFENSNPFSPLQTSNDRSFCKGAPAPSPPSAK